MQTQAVLSSLIQELQRPINCLLDSNRNIRKQGLTSIQTILFSKSPELITQIFLKTKISKNLYNTIEDPIQKHRQVALKLIKKYLIIVQNGKNINLDVLELFLKGLINRINTTPFAETCEELRLEIIRIFELFLNYSQLIIINLNEFSSAIAKCLSDSYPDLKKQCCILINLISNHPSLKYKIGYSSSNIIKALANNLGHQHAAVRKSSIQSLGNLLITQGCGQNYQFVKQAIFGISFNKSGEVRRATFECVGKLINYFSLKLLGSYQGSLIGILLNGLSDESQEIVELTKRLLDECGEKLMEANKQKIVPMEVQN